MLDGWAYGDLLRVVGDLLDAESAEHVEIVQHPEALTLSWASAANQFTHRSVRDVNLDVLQQQARALRGKEKAGGTSPRVELLRTLGQLLDYEQLTLGGIVEEPHGYRVSGVVNGRYRQQLYTWAMLDHTSAEARALRRPTPARQATHWQFWKR